MKKSLRCVVAWCIVVFLLTANAYAASSFPDVDEYAEYAEAVKYVSEAGVMVGDENGNFNPNKTVTRAEMATIICRMLGMTENLPASSAFSDVPINHWANKHIGRAAELGIVNGYGNGMFGPSDNVTYEQVVTMIIRAIGGGDEAADLGGYPDGFFAVANAAELLVDIHSERYEPLSRGDIAMILYRYYCVASVQ